VTALSTGEPPAVGVSPPSRSGVNTKPVGGERDWVAELCSDGPEREDALRSLHALMLRAAGHQVWRMRAALPDASHQAVDVIVNQAADEAMTALLGKLHSFQGRSRFTTWAFKFAILQAATEVRRIQWQHREVELRDVDVRPAPTHESPELSAEGTDLAVAVADAMHRVLTPYQRRIAVALLVDDVPIDVLAERLGTSRGALYKTLHDVRVRLRQELTARAYLPVTRPMPSPVATEQPDDAPSTPTGGTR
jgi:RNA polymerase sigma-70 factor (ECF subfamily)